MNQPAEARDTTREAMDGCVIVVEFDVADGMLERFTTLVRENARLSVEREAGCRRFDVLLPAGGSTPRVMLYEIYDDRAAFDLHLGTPHFLDFDEATRPMVTAKRVMEYGLFEATK